MADPAIITDEGTFSSRDGTLLYARSARPAGGPVWARLCLATGYGDHSARYEHVLAFLAENGIAAQAVDFRGQGRAGGRRGFVRRWDEYLDDWEAFLGREAREWPADAGAAPPPRFVLGQSHGGLIVVEAALHGRLPPDIAGAVLTAPYLRLKMVPPPAKLRLAYAADRFAPWLPVRTEVPQDWMSADPEMREADRADPLSLSVATPRWFIRTLAAQEEALRRAGEFTLPLLALAGDADELADSGATREFYEAAGSADKTFTSLTGLRHEPLRELDRQAVLDGILAWLRGHVGERGKPD